MSATEENPYTKKLKERLAIHPIPDLEKAVDEVRNELKNLGFELDQNKKQQLFAAASSLKEEVRNSIRLLQAPSILSQGRQEEWYTSSRQDSIHWPALLKYLKEIKNWDDDTIETINRSSSQVTGKLGNPELSEFSCRGLVVGHVQSGKTANMTAVIARAVDAGYNLVVILAGMTDTLRHQTQSRIEEDLVQRNPHNWYLLTKKNQYDSEGNQIASGEYSGQSGKQMPRISSDQAALAVIKKNRGPLEKLAQDLDGTLTYVKKSFKVLVIDDEADQASVNTANENEGIARINLKIRELLHRFPAVTYIGYTATPFANMLINPFPPESHVFDAKHLDDLYPKDFIIALPRSKKYFGTERLFGKDPVDAEMPEDDGLNVIRDVSQENLESLCPTSRAKASNFSPVICDSLETALKYFLMACAARKVRHHNAHMTMLIHTHHTINIHEKTLQLVRKWLDNFVTSLERDKNSIANDLRKIWQQERCKVPDDITEKNHVLFDDLYPYIIEVLNDTKTIMENSLSDERLNFSGKPKFWIVIGGNLLARGLTLEGLLVSYFVRASRQYDTLLQMGRWFGYREGYEDLPRIWMTETLATAYRRLATVEHELRQEIEEYIECEATPLDFAVRIRSYPGLAVTARNKMRHAINADINYSGKHIQTIRFQHTNQMLQAKNWRAGGDLLERIKGFRDRDKPDEYNFKKVPIEDIARFLSEYQVAPSHRDLTSNYLLKYIRENDNVLSKWNVVVIQSQIKGKKGETPLGPLLNPWLNTRSRLNLGNQDEADIKALMSRKDVVSDCPETTSTPTNDDWLSLKLWREEQIGSYPLLLLYPIDSESKPKRSSDKRTSLNASHDILGFGIIFPQGKLGALGGSIRIQVSMSEDEIDANDFDESPEEIVNQSAG